MKYYPINDVQVVPLNHGWERTKPVCRVKIARRRPVIGCPAQHHSIGDDALMFPNILCVWFTDEKRPYPSVKQGLVFPPARRPTAKNKRRGAKHAPGGVEAPFLRRRNREEIAMTPSLARHLALVFFAPPLTTVLGLSIIIWKIRRG